MGDIDQSTEDTSNVQYDLRFSFHRMIVLSQSINETRKTFKIRGLTQSKEKVCQLIVANLKQTEDIPVNYGSQLETNSSKQKV